MASGMPRARNISMKGAQSLMVAIGTGSCPLSKSACFTRLTSPIHVKAPGYSCSRSCIPERIDAGCDRSGNVIASVRWVPAGACVT